MLEKKNISKIFTTQRLEADTASNLTFFSGILQAKICLL